MDVAVVMPVWGQGPLLCESITSVLAQETDARVLILLMDDACPQQETVDICRRFARAYPDRVVYWRSSENRGLAAMRNEGAELALSLHPDLFAILSFDGDDRMHPKLIDRSLRALRKAIGKNPDSSHKVGWVFEDPDHFGQDGVMLRTHRYSALWSMAGCANCPTSLTNADIYRDGIRFREDMKSGSEDWQFWLTCLAKGYRGVFVPHLGFRYRRKPGSMSVGALQLADSNRTDIRLSRKDIFNPDTFLTHEAQEMPRYLIADPTGQCKICPDASLEGEATQVSEIARDWAEHARMPTHGIPQYLIFAAGSVIEALRDARLLPWALWRLEHAARATGISSLGQSEHSSPLIRCLRADRVMDVCTGRLNPKDLSGKTHRKNEVPAGIAAETNTATVFLGFLTSLGAEWRRLAPHRRTDMAVWRPFGLRQHDLCQNFFGFPTLLSGNRAQATAIVADATSLQDAKARQGIQDLIDIIAATDIRAPSMVLIGGKEVPPLHDVAEIFFVPEENTGMDDAALAGLLAPFGTIIDAGSLVAVPVLNQIKGHGRRIVASLASDASTPLGRDLITCFKVFDQVLVHTQRDRDRCLSQGVAAEQIMDAAHIAA